MLRKIITINEELCNGCGICVNACHESAIGLVNGKAKLLRDDYCDGLGACLPGCPMNAISFEERDTLEYNEEEVKRNQEAALKQKEALLQNQNKESDKEEPKSATGCGCPGSRVIDFSEKNKEEVNNQPVVPTSNQSMLRNWPVQIKLAPVNASYFNNANLLIAADCTAYAYADIHQLMKNKITLIGCPKLDAVDYSEKLGQILSMNQIKSVTVIRMEVPCCGGIVNAVTTALKACDKMIPWNIITISTDGAILEDN
ncbi:MAG: 4Fe-4S binding protein [Mobilitalea sp.]